ncbi:MAG: hypothetical protein RBS80_18425 [Thermoguttaceae bacterium]|nr:hypothetical protein [Thermoguttaceae bacterium]
MGRDRLIQQIWRKLQTQSLRFTAERRIGKTTVMRKMRAECRPGNELIFVDLEKVDLPRRFTEILLTEMWPRLSAKQKAANRFTTFLTGIGGIEVAGVVKLPERDRIGWKATLEKTFECVCSQSPDVAIVLLLDELPYMLQKIAAQERREGRSEHAALEILDSLRAMRQQHANLRMIFAGSVGLHHVLSDLRGSEFASEPVNDMPLVPIEALALPDAVTLAKRLLKDEGVQVVEADRERLPGELAALTDRVPFYLERVVWRLAELEGPVSVEHARQVVRQQMTDDNDAWEMEHFRSRLEIYYPGSSTDANEKPIPNASLARAILDILAVAPTPQTIDEVWAAMKARMPLDDRNQIVQLLKSLAQDHYLTSDSEKRYAFRFPLIRQWWALAQGLSS